MHALTLARQRLRTRLQHPGTPRPVRLAHGLVSNGRGRFLPVLSSPLAQEILSRGYDAGTLDHIYADRPLGDMGLVGRLADRLVLDLPVHRALRERFEAAVGEICAAAVLAIRAGEAEFRMLFAPCGHGSELAAVADRLRSERPETFRRLRCWGIDADPYGRALADAAGRARARELCATFLRDDAHTARELAALTEQQGPFQLISCLNLTARQPLPVAAGILRRYAALLAPGGTLVVDRWEPVEQTLLSASLGRQFEQIRGAELRGVLAGCGLTSVREHPTGEGGCVLTVARKAA